MLMPVDLSAAAWSIISSTALKGKSILSAKLWRKPPVTAIFSSPFNFLRPSSYLRQLLQIFRLCEVWVEYYSWTVSFISSELQSSARHRNLLMLRENTTLRHQNACGKR